MLEPILKGLVEWLYEMMLDIMAYASGELLGVMSMDLSYFEKTAPVISDIVNVFIALGWALLIGNLVFQSLKSIMSGAGFEAEDPKILFLRTFVFAFLLLASRQICDIGSSITGIVIDMLELPDAINVTTPDESMFSLGAGAKWLLVIIVGVVLMVQMVKLLFEIGERYVITSVLTFFAPLAFAMGGSKNTNDIFKGWCRMYGSMLVMMIMNIVFLKLIMSAMSQMTSGGVLIWLVFVVALTRVARKIDSHIGKIGLNPSQTGAGIGSRIPGVMTMVAVRTMGSLVSRSMANAKGGSGGKSTGNRSSGRDGSFGSTNRNPNPNSPRPSGGYGSAAPSNQTVSTTSSVSAGNTNTYAGGGGVNVNHGSTSTNVGGSHTNVGKPTSESAHSNTSNVGIQNVPGFKDGNIPGAKMTANAAQSGRNMGVAVHRGIQNNGQSGSNSTNVQQNGTMQRPPIPRCTAGIYPKSVNPMASVVNSSNHPQSHSDASTVSGSTQQKGRNGKIPSPVSASPVASGGIHQNMSGSVRQNGGQTTIHSDAVHNRSDMQGNIQKSGNISGGGVYSAKIGGNHAGVDASSVNLNGSTQMHSEHSGSEHFTDKSSEHFIERNHSGFTQMQSRTETTEKRANHEYKHGRYNPAAANKKVKKTYYQKEDFQQKHTQRHGRMTERGENNRKRKQ